MSKIKYRVNDQSRVLLADMLPYETPFIFSNVGFFKWYTNYQNGHISKVARSYLEEIALSPAIGQTIPYHFSINRSGGGQLQLSVIHPRSQVRFINFYRQYDSLITNQCSKSQYSIRFPKSRHAEYIRNHDPNHRKPRPGDPVDVEAEDFDVEQLYPHTYFVYGGYNLLYKFFESAQFFRIEKRFSHGLSFDISKCFFNIYTHTIAWAVKSKAFAKKYRNATNFEREFDDSIQCANYKETNGIPVGPEVSRIFAEIILQEVDRNVENILNERGFRLNDDYVVVRYVDDYYIFVHDVRQAYIIKSVFEQELLNYKLFINGENSKNSFTIPQFSSICKVDCCKNISDLFDLLFYKENGTTSPKYISRPLLVTKNVIKRIKEAALLGGATISGSAARVLFQIRDKLEEHLGQEHEKVIRDTEGSNIGSVFEVIIELSTFFVCHAYKAQPLVAFSHILLILRDEVRHYDETTRESVRTRLIEEFNQMFLSTPDADPFSIERLNSLLLIRELDHEMLFKDKRFSQIFVELKKN